MLATHSYFAIFMTWEIPAARWKFRQNSKALAWRWRQVWTFKNNIPTLNASVSTSKVYILELTIEKYHKKCSVLIRPRFLSLAPIKPVAFFLGHSSHLFDFDEIYKIFMASLIHRRHI